MTYQFEPGTDADGVTVHIPLPLLNQVEMTGFDWQIPGLREELVIALIKSLPKSYRRNFVPAPNYAQAFLSRAMPLEKPLLDTLIYELRRMTGVTVEAEHWNWEQIPSHLKMTFRVVDENGKKIAESMNLDELKFNLKIVCRKVFLLWQMMALSKAGCIFGVLQIYHNVTNKKTTWF